jgi:hypothetical protein
MLGKRAGHHEVGRRIVPEEAEDLRLMNRVMVSLPRRVLHQAAHD